MGCGIVPRFGCGASVPFENAVLAAVAAPPALATDKAGPPPRNITVKNEKTLCATFLRKKCKSIFDFVRNILAHKVQKILKVFGLCAQHSCAQSAKGFWTLCATFLRTKCKKFSTLPATLLILCRQVPKVFCFCRQHVFAEGGGLSASAKVNVNGIGLLARPRLPSQTPLRLPLEGSAGVGGNGRRRPRQGERGHGHRAPTRARPLGSRSDLQGSQKFASRLLVKSAPRPKNWLLELSTNRLAVPGTSGSPRSDRDCPSRAVASHPFPQKGFEHTFS